MRIPRWLGVLGLTLLVLLGCLALNAAAYHAWAGGGPPSPRPKWHRAWSGRFLWLAAACFAPVIWQLGRFLRRISAHRTDTAS